MFDVGDKVVYPHHGAGTVEKKEVKVVLGEEREYLTIRILHNEMTVNVPVDNCEKVGLRGVIDLEMVEVVQKVLLGGSTEMPKNWNRRFKHNRDKMKTGDIFELAEVVRNLSLRDHEKGLSTGEKQMFVKAKKILASELMYAKAMDEAEAGVWLDDVLSTVANGKKKSKVVPKKSKKPVVEEDDDDEEDDEEEEDDEDEDEEDEDDEEEDERPAKKKKRAGPVMTPQSSKIPKSFIEAKKMKLEMDPVLIKAFKEFGEIPEFLKIATLPANRQKGPVGLYRWRLAKEAEKAAAEKAARIKAKKKKAK